jgi:hypothetical protein
LEIVKFAFDTGYNVSRINMGLDRAKKRVVGLEVSPFWGANREFYRRLKERYKGRISYCKPELIGHKWKGSAWKLQVVVADRPGMVVRILTALALLGQKVLSVAIGDREKESKFLRELDLAEIDLIFQKGSKKCKFDLRAVMAELASSPGVYAVRPCGEITAAR